MMRSACLILGSYLALQGVGPEGRQEDNRIQNVPLYHTEHARELLDHNAGVFKIASNVNSQEVAQFVQVRTSELLPAQFRSQTERISQALIATANEQHMDPLFLMAVIRQESRFNPEALGTHGEVGLMQIKPATAQWLLERQGKDVPSEAELRVSLKDPVFNIRLGASYFAHLRKTFKGRHSMYITAYNMGAESLRNQLRQGAHPHEYSDKVLAGYTEFTLGAQPQRRFVIPTRFPASFSPTFDL